MKRKSKKNIRLLQIMGVALLFAIGAFFEKPISDQMGQSKLPSNESGGLVVDYLDVGQSDATLISKGNFHMLIDAGGNEKGKKVVEYLRKRKIKKLDILVGTHPDTDHIGGLDDIILGLEVGRVYMPSLKKDTKTYTDVLSALKKRKKKAEVPIIGKEVVYDGDLHMRFLSPEKEYSDANESSIVVQIGYGRTKFLFMGDAEEVNEKAMIAAGYDLECDVIKLGHHGSSSSTCDEFLKKTNPTYALISCGEGNSYGHPHVETLSKLEEEDVQVYRTDKMGTIRAVSDGKNIKMST